MFAHYSSALHENTGVAFGIPVNPSSAVGEKRTDDAIKQGIKMAKSFRSLYITHPAAYVLYQKYMLWLGEKQVSVNLFNIFKICNISKFRRKDSSLILILALTSASALTSTSTLTLTLVAH